VVEFKRDSKSASQQHLETSLALAPELRRYGVRHPGLRRRPRTLSQAYTRFPGALLLQGARHLPLVQRLAYGRDRRPSGRSRLPTPAGAPVGAISAQALRWYLEREPKAVTVVLHIFLRVVEASCGEAVSGPRHGPTSGP